MWRHVVASQPETYFRAIIRKTVGGEDRVCHDFAGEHCVAELNRSLRRHASVRGLRGSGCACGDRLIRERRRLHANQESASSIKSAGCSSHALLYIFEGAVTGTGATTRVTVTGTGTGAPLPGENRGEAERIVIAVCM